MAQQGTKNKPLIGILKDSHRPIDQRWLDPFSSCKTIIIDPANRCVKKINDHLSQIDSLLLIGSNNHIAPRFGGPEITGRNHDEQRNALSIPMIQNAYDLDMPVFGICFGMQEIISAFNGKISQLKDEIHASGYTAKNDQKYSTTPAHGIDIAAKGKLSTIFSGDVPARVNSIHHDGITLADWFNAPALQESLQIEATTPGNDQDIQNIEAISAKHKSFFLGVQWHPEFAEDHTRDPLFNTFIKAAQQYRNKQSQDLNIPPLV